MNNNRSMPADWNTISQAGRRQRGALYFAGVAIFASALLIGCSNKEAAEEAPTVSVQVGAAEKGTIERKVASDAVLYPLDQAAIVPKVTAPVKKFYVERGSRVHAGDVLAELENEDLTGAALEGQGGYAQAQAAYQAAVQKAEQDLKLAKEQLDAQQKLYDSRQMLLRQGAVSQKDVEDANVQLIQARNAYEAAQKQLDLKAAEGQMTAAKGHNMSAAAQLSYTKIISPIDGVVTDRPVYPGETAPSGSPLITVMNTTQVVARAHIAQQEAAQLKVGDPATIVVPGEAKPFPGKVTLVSPALDPGSTTVEVWVQAANPEGHLRPGTGARVTIVAQSVNTIVAPSAALLTAQDGSTSMISLDTDNKPHRKKVKVGIRDGGNLQVLDGLKEGDRVVTVGAFELDRMDEDVLPKVKIQVQAPQGVQLEEDEDN